MLAAFQQILSMTISLRRLCGMAQGKTQMLQVRLLNMGRLPSSFRTKLEPHAAFRLTMPGAVADSEPVLQTLQPSQDMLVNLTFSPPEAANYAHEVIKTPCQLHLTKFHCAYTHYSL